MKTSAYRLAAAAGDGERKEKGSFEREGSTIVGTILECVSMLWFFDSWRIPVVGGKGRESEDGNG